MAQHGYLHDTYDRDDFGRGDEQRERSWRGPDDDRGWRGREAERGSGRRDSEWSDRDRERGSMFGWRDDDRHSSDRHRDDDRGFLDRAGNEVSSWFGDDDHRRQDRSSARRSQSHQSGFGGASEWRQSGQRYSAHPDDHYRSWRDKQMQALDRDYQDYCREREEQFHSDFDSWRQNRQGQASQGQASMEGSSSNQTLELDEAASRGGEVQGATTSPMGAATMGTNNSENSATAPGGTGRGKR